MHIPSEHATRSCDISFSAEGWSLSGLNDWPHQLQNLASSRLSLPHPGQSLLSKVKSHLGQRMYLSPEINYRRTDKTAKPK
jgi:hypothetical protein